MIFENSIRALVFAVVHTPRGYVPGLTPTHLGSLTGLCEALVPG